MRCTNPSGILGTNRSLNLGQTNRPYNYQQKSCRIVDFVVPADNRVKLIESENKRISTTTLLGIEKTVKHESDGDTNCNWCSWYSYQRIGTGTGGLRNNRTIGEYSNYCIVTIGHNTEKRRGDLKRLAVTPTPVKDHQLKKALREKNNNSYSQQKVNLPNSGLCRPSRQQK